MRLRSDVAQVFRDYPRIYFACHRRHVRDTRRGKLVSARQASTLDHLDAVAPTMLSDLAAHLRVTRVLDPVDRRKVQLRLTDAGVRISAANSVLEPALVGDMLDHLPERDRR